MMGNEGHVDSISPDEFQFPQRYERLEYEATYPEKKRLPPTYSQDTSSNDATVPLVSESKKKSVAGFKSR